MRLFQDPADEGDVSDEEASPTTAAPLKITVLRNVTVEEIGPYFTKQAARAGRTAEVTFGAYDNIVQDANGAAPHLFPSGCDLVLVVTHLETLSPALANGFAALSVDEVAQEIENCSALVDMVVRGIRGQTKATLLWTSFEPPAYPAFGIADRQSEQGQTAAIARLNRRLLDGLRSASSAYAIDMGTIALKLGIDAFYDLRYWHLGKAPYSRAALSHVAADAFKFVRAEQGLARKCLVLDCDNTLWGGVVGEDGLSGIKLGPNFPGSAYLEFQRQVLELRARGVIIAILSKNNEEDVWEVFDDHPEMVLKREHLSAWRVNWQDKASNIRELATELNIGLNSMVFVDDSDFELDLVSSQVPEVMVMKAQTRKASENRWKLASLGVFDLPELTEEDRQRSTMYAQERQRQGAKQGMTDMASYLTSLQIEIDVFLVDAVSIPRIAQQTQKTNQFNLTTKRYSEAEILQFTKEEGYAVLACSVIDKHGKMGIVGTIVLEQAGDVATLDTMLLSCRALGRGIEGRFLDEVIELAKERGVRQMRGQYIPTAKNAQVESFFDGRGFALTATGDDGAKFYSLDLDGWEPAGDDHFASVSSPSQA